MTYMHVVHHILRPILPRTAMQKQSRKTGNLTIVCALLTAMLAGLAADAHAAGSSANKKKTYMWKDADGNVYYSNQVPPEASRQERIIINEHGMRVNKLEAAKTREQILEEKRQQELREEQERIARERAEYDRKLLTTYDSEESMVRARDGKITYVENDITANKFTLKQQQEYLAQHRRSAANYERSGKEVPENVLKKMQETKEQIEKTELYIAERRIEQKEIRNAFEKDILRYRKIIEEREARKAKENP